MTPDDDDLSYAGRLPPPDQLAMLLERDPVRALLPLARTRAVVAPGIDVVARPDADLGAARELLERAQAIAARVAAEGDAAVLDDDDREALQLFLLLSSRPAMFVVDGRVSERPANWPEITYATEQITRRIKGVGRIELPGGGRQMAVGSGFIAGPKRVLTNNHVVTALLGETDLARWSADHQWYARTIAQANEKWASGAGPRFELLGEVDSVASCSTAITRVAGTHRNLDVAVLEIAEMPDGSQPLRIGTSEPTGLVGRKVYALGYPQSDRSTPAHIIDRIFGSAEARATKRCSPGLVMARPADHRFTHDASTLPGSSGSAIVDIEQNEVVGIHYAGSFRRSNAAVALWTLRDDPVLVDNGVIFGGRT